MEARTYDERRTAALEVLGGFLGEGDAESVARSMRRRLGALGDFAIDVVLGDVWARPRLSRRDRSLIVISVLATLGSVPRAIAGVRAMQAAFGEIDDAGGT